MTSSNTPWTLTSHLLSTNVNKFTRATQSPFLRLAASGKLSKPVISQWLANDRLYMLGYIRLAGELLRILKLPGKPTPSKDAGVIEVRLLDWLVDALVNIRREERFFMDVAERFGLDVDITTSDGVVAEEKKVEGLKRFENLFNSLTTAQPPSFLPWLEGLVVFWATEKVYFEAWSWAKRKAEESGEASSDASKDEDGGAMRKEFIPNWTNEEFIKFVNTLEKIVNEGVQEAIGGDESLKRQVVERATTRWKELLDAEEGFWPKV
ncbi:hypothetical protein B0J11DRAFT_337595 [Dendryphion nanum]|uniref:Heme oxygenase-like protein n=1 Tax=Dendryphion nanum TaxID=256645 RepID=A0A9P9DPS6_9PLEO|nr:hypothetical protein B0J11DRAFT_337595 [Dendryphion nanum]